MKKILILIPVIALVMCSCRSVNKSLVKTSDKEKTQIEAHNTGTNTAAGTNSTALNRTITEEFADTNTVKPPVITGSVSTADLDHGQVAHIETPAGNIAAQINPKTGALTFTSTPSTIKVPVSGKKTTIENINSVSTQSSAGSFTQDLKLKQEKQSDHLDSNVSRKVNIWPWVAIFGLCAVFILLIILWLRRKKKQAEKLTKS